jgi:probable phosphoglycerate mutase
VLIVGHGAMNMSLICNVWKLPTKDFWRTGIKNCKLIRLL